MEVDPYKYYTKEQYEKYGCILETAIQIEQRILKHKLLDEENKKLMQKYRDEWALRMKLARGEKVECDFI